MFHSTRKQMASVSFGSILSCHLWPERRKNLWMSQNQDFAVVSEFNWTHWTLVDVAVVQQLHLTKCYLSLLEKVLISRPNQSNVCNYWVLSKIGIGCTIDIFTYLEYQLLVSAQNSPPLKTVFTIDQRCKKSSLIKPRWRQSHPTLECTWLDQDWTRSHQ